MIGVAGYTGNFTFWIEGHISRHIHRGDYVKGMRKAYGCFMKIIMAGDTYFIGFMITIQIAASLQKYDLLMVSIASGSLFILNPVYHLLSGTKRPPFFALPSFFIVSGSLPGVTLS